MTDASVFKISKSCMHANPPAQMSFIHNAIFYCFSLLPPSRRIAENELLIFHCNAAAIGTRFTTGESNVCSIALPSALYAPLVRYPKLKITRDLLQSQTAVRKQASDQHLFRHDSEHVLLVNTFRVRSSLVANQQGVFQLRASFPCY